MAGQIVTPGESAKNGHERLRIFWFSLSGRSPADDMVEIPTLEQDMRGHGETRPQTEGKLNDNMIETAEALLRQVTLHDVTPPRRPPVPFGRCRLWKPPCCPVSFRSSA